MIYLLKDCEHIIAPDRHRKEALDMKQSRSGLPSGMGQSSGLLASCLGWPGASSEDEGAFQTGAG